jgi:hypothetical protein
MQTCGMRISGNEGELDTQSRRRSLPIEFRSGSLAGGNSVLQVPPAQWAAGRHRINNPAKRYAVGIGTRSHRRPPNGRGIEADFSLRIGTFRSHANTALKPSRASFRFAQINFSSNSDPHAFLMRVATTVVQSLPNRNLVDAGSELTDGANTATAFPDH